MSVEELLIEAELSKAISDAEKAALDVRLAELQVRKQEIENLEEEINLSYHLSGVYHLHQGINKRTMNRLFKQMRVWHKYDSKAPWIIYLHSIGGDWWEGNGIIDELVSHSIRGNGTHEITIKVRGVAASMAGIILQAADHRVMGPSSELMIHKGSGGICGSTESIGDEHEYLRRSNDAMIALFLSRTDKITRPEFLRKINRKDWWMTSSEALRWGFCDAIG